MADFKTCDFTFDDCIKDGDFTPEFKEFLSRDTMGRMYLSGFIGQSKEDFVNDLLNAVAMAGPLDSFKAFMKPYIEKLESETGYKYNERESRWRHCNDIAMMRSTLQFDRGGSLCLLCVFEGRLMQNGKVNADAYVKEGIGARNWNHIDRCGIRKTLPDYFDSIIEFCK